VSISIIIYNCYIIASYRNYSSSPGCSVTPISTGSG
jgi:hypothetical protein